MPRVTCLSVDEQRRYRFFVTDIPHSRRRQSLPFALECQMLHLNRVIAWTRSLIASRNQRSLDSVPHGVQEPVLVAFSWQRDGHTRFLRASRVTDNAPRPLLLLNPAGRIPYHHTFKPPGEAVRCTLQRADALRPGFPPRPLLRSKGRWGRGGSGVACGGCACWRGGGRYRREAGGGAAAAAGGA